MMTLRSLARTGLLLALALAAGSTAAQAAPALPAFPGAEGFGSTTPGGRGGKVITVDNLNDDGPGSLRAALQTPGKRIVVFRTGGLITLKSEITISEPYVTVAGQTAPGDGICLKAAPEQGGALIGVKTNNVVLRGLRLRAGADGKPAQGDNRDNLSLGTGALYDPATQTGKAHDIIVDHCSFSWSVDENIQIWYRNRDITIQNCLLAEGLHYSIHPKSQNPPKGAPFPQSHSFGLLISGDGQKNVSVHHNLFALNYGRNPRIDSNCSVELINNVMYGWGFRAVDLVGGKEPMLINLIGNFFKPGAAKHAPCIFVTEGKNAPTDGSGFYLQGNFSAENAGAQDAWDAAGGWADRAAMIAKYRKEQPAFPPSGIAADADARAAYDKVMARAGAFPRDAVDRRIVDHVTNGTGRQWVNYPREVGDYPQYAPGTAPADTDNDGMPDEWEKKNGLDPKVDDSAGTKLSREGYTNIEVYVNGLIER